MEVLYKKASSIIVSIEKLIFYYRKQNYYTGNSIETEILDKLTEIIDILIKEKYLTEQSAAELLAPFLEAKKNKDYVLLADLYELQMLPFLNEIQNRMRQEGIEESGYWQENMSVLEKQDKSLWDNLRQWERKNSDIQYYVEDTNIGSKTIKAVYDKRSWYLHSNGNPWMEGMAFAEEYYEEEQSEYAILGFGMGYHVKELWEKGNYIRITVFETELEVLCLALKYQNFAQMLSSGRVKIVYDPELQFMNRFLKEFRGNFLVYAPVLGYIKQKGRREAAEEYFINLSSVKAQGAMLTENFQQNKKYFCRFVDGLKEKWKEKEIVIAAGGPSLDEDIDSLREIRKERILISVGTVFKKLLKNGIRPDYVIITDAKETQRKQIDNVDTRGIPLLYLSTVSPEVIKAYEGEKYCILQQGFSQAESLAQKKGLDLYQTGGSVATTAIELAIRFGHKKIVCFGLDLAYTGEQSHAKDTLGYKKADVSGMRKVTSVNGDVVPTTKNLDSYRHWIERRIEKEEDIEFLNISRGAYIKGMKNQISI